MTVSITHTKRTRGLSILFATLFSLTFSAYALTISPARLELGANPGDTVQETFTIINEQDTEQVYYTSVENFEAQGESGTPNFTKSNEGLASWVTVDEKITLKKGEKLKVPFSVTVPTDADAGGHFAAIFLSTQPPSLNGGDVSVGAKIGMLLLLRVSGDIKEEGGALSFTIKDGGKIVTTLPVDFVYRFNNTGNDRVKPTGVITVKNTFGMETQNLNANKNEGNVLPSSVRRFEVRWGEEDAPPASASFFSFVKYEMKNFALGLYFADLNLSFGTNGTSENSLYFFVLPWHLLTVIFVTLAVVILILRGALKRYNKWIIKQARLANGN